MSLFSFQELEEGDAARLFTWRRSPRVARYLIGEPPMDMASHLNWLSRVAASEETWLWVVVAGGQKVGQVNISDLDPAARECEWGYYLGEDAALGLGGLIPPYVYNFLFFELGLARLKANVLSNNPDVLDLHAFHGYRLNAKEPAGLVRDGRSLELHHLILTREAWLALPKFHRFRALFPLPESLLGRFR